ncbi:COMM domain-containing protein 5 [Cephus cinctus]|uniref:COMM domain-containing protein 5 n=1 Tax=Cephus cinctus TaxID=211228 RepID=A0AAJ7FRJ2_CEPCN|nr:COMM domain-containing protein 5 [Cephus cinctus]
MSTTFQMQVHSSLANKIKYLAELKKMIARPLTQLAVKAIEQEHIEPGILERISEKYNVPQENVDEWYAAILTILRLHLRSTAGSVKPTEFKQCLQELKLAPECIEDLSTVVYGQRRPVLIHGLINDTNFYPRLKSCKWRVDITISSSVLSRVLEPSILMEWTLNTGERHIFELSLARFHQLRHTVASLLLEMQSMENCGLLKSVQTS